MASANSFIGRITRLPQGVIRYIKESYAELRKVSWPSRETTIRYTVIVAAASVIVGAVVGGIDFLLTYAFEKIIL
jgi:preprotein translocase subunit SecE